MFYRYPLIQYRWQQGQGVISAWSEATDTILNVSWLNLPLRLGEDQVQVDDALITVKQAHFGISERLLHYRLLTPALIFNQNNINQYRHLGAAAQQSERERLLVAQLLRSLKGLQVNFPVTLYAAFTQTQFSSCPYKGRNLVGISGEFVSNALLPCSSCEVCSTVCSVCARISSKVVTRSSIKGMVCHPEYE